MDTHKIARLTAQATSVIFHPLLIPTLGFLLLFNSGFYFAMIPWHVRQIILLIVFVSTAVLPALSIGILALNPHFDRKMGKSTDRVLPLLISSVYYFMGYLLLKRIPIFPIYNFFLIASILVQIVLLIISMKWKISAHSAAIGGLIGGFLGLSFRLQENPAFLLSMLILIAGMVGTSRLILQKHTSWQVYAGFSVGLIIMLATFSYL